MTRRLPLLRSSAVILVLSVASSAAQAVDCYPRNSDAGGSPFVDCNQNGFPDRCDLAPSVEESPAPPFYRAAHADSLAAIHIDDDGRLDLIVGRTLLLGDGQGLFFEFGQLERASEDSGQTRVNAVADFNADGLDDVALLSIVDSQTAVLSVYLRSEKEGFHLSASFSAANKRPDNCGSESLQNIIAAADFDGDGDIDIIHAPGLENSTNLHVFLNDGAGLFDSAEFSGGRNKVFEVLFADLDGDGTEDLITASSSVPQLAVHRNLGNGIYAAPSPLPTPNGVLEKLIAVDLDGDKRVEVSGKTSCQSFIQVVWNDRAGFLAENFSSFSAINSLQAIDIDGDTIPELFSISGTRLHTSTNVLLRRYVSDFRSLGFSASTLVAADFNNDGQLDAVVGGDSTFLYLKGSEGFEFDALRETGSGTYSSQTLDIDGDGDRDLITKTPDGALQLLTQTTPLAFGTSQLIPNTDKVLATSLICLDRQAKGNRKDPNGLAVLSAAEVASQIVVLMNRGGKLEETVTIFHPTPLRGLTAGDFDQDGLEDIVAVPGLWWFRNLGDGSFAEGVSYANGDPFFFVHVADLNGDGFDDLIASGDQVPTSLQLYTSTPEGLAPPELLLESKLPVVDIQQVDLTGDGQQDLLLTTTCVFCHFQESRILLLRNDGAEGFTLTEIIAPDGPPLVGLLRPAVIDLDRDGDFEILTLANRRSGTNLFTQNSDGGFDFAGTLQAVSNGPVFIEDLDGDGSVELLTQPSVTRITELAVSPAESRDRNSNLTPDECEGLSEFRRGDSNWDETVNLSDAIRTLRVLFLNSGQLVCLDAADANDDGALNISDALATLSYLFGSHALPAPGPFDCGLDPSQDRLSCARINDCTP